MKTTNVAPATAATREEWLRNASVQLAATYLAKQGITLPELQVSVGFPKGQSGRARAIGQCFYPVMARDKRAHLFICPTQDEPARVLDILLHELIHAVLPVGTGHKGAFKRVAVACGLEGKMTATVAGKALSAELAAMARELGTYAHGALQVETRGKKGSRLRLFECECGIKVRVARDEFDATCGECDGRFERAA